MLLKLPLSAEKLLYIRAALIKALGAISAFFLTVVAAKVLSSEATGMFMLTYTILLVCVAIFRFGMDGIILRELSGNVEVGRALHSTALIFVFLTSSILAFLFYSYSDYIAIEIFDKPELSTLMSTMLWALPLMTFYTLIGVGYQSIHKVEWFVFFQNLGVSSVFIILILSVGWNVNGAISSNEAALTFLVSAFCIFLISLKWFFTNRTAPDFKRRSLYRLFSSSKNIFVSEVMVQSVAWSGVIVGGIWLSASDLAYLTISQRTAMLISFILMVVNMVLPVRIARLWSENKIDEIQKVSNACCRSLLLIIVPLCTALILMSDFILSFFGSDYAGASLVFSILVVGQAVGVSLGPVGFLLLMTENEKSYRNATLVSGIVSITLVVILTREFGVIGSACAVAFSTAFGKVLLAIQVRQKLGFWPFIK